MPMTPLTKVFIYEDDEVFGEDAEYKFVHDGKQSILYVTCRGLGLDNFKVENPLTGTRYESCEEDNTIHGISYYGQEDTLEKTLEKMSHSIIGQNKQKKSES